MAAQGERPPLAPMPRRAVALAASTGGPAALERVLCDMRACLESQGVERAGVPPVFITQHLSAP
ncbi:MAG: hypothetical protein Q8K65_09055, partial [Alphaproteobacteria bacterium]|nr:hypothetical protein [Alphaproteobacteria bacterium]